MNSLSKEKIPDKKVREGRKTLNKILITLPALHGQGGVASYYNSILPHLQKHSPVIKTLEIGSWGNKIFFLQPLQDQFSFQQACKKKPQLIHVNPSLGSKSFWRDGLFAWQAKRNKIPLLVFFRGWNHDFAKVVEKRYLPFFKNTFAKADGFIVLASDFENQLRKWGVTAPIYIETTAVDEELVKNYQFPEREILGTHLAKPKILFLSRLEKEKGVFETIDAVRILVNQGTRIRLSIAGDGSAKNKAEQYVESLKLTGSISFLGYVRGEDKINAFKQHDIYCFPTSHGEGLPNSVLEAMAFGMPIISTHVGGLKDIFQDGKMGFTLTNTKPTTIANQLQRLIDHPELNQQISTFNFNYAKEHFMASKVAARITDIYSNLLKKQKICL